VHNGTGCSKCSLQTSRIEIAVYSELKALFGDVSWREPISGYECDVFLAESHVGVEIDGVYWHRRRPAQELEKSAAFEAHKVQLFRLREDGLSLLSERDVTFTSSEDEFQVVSRLVKSLLTFAELSEQRTAKLCEYVDGPGLINETLYRQMVANLPAPPPGDSLAYKYPEIAKEWAYDLNAPLSPEHFRPQANKKVWWRCENHHTWKTTPNIRVFQRTGCPSCPRKAVVAPADRSLAAVNPGLASEWHPEQNRELQATDVWPNSNRKVWWRCGQGHEWRATVASRAAGTGCPYCYGRYATSENNLASRYPELLEEWDQERNADLSPAQLTSHSNRKVWWHCGKGHSWQATIYNRTRNRSGCLLCARDAGRRYSIDDINAIANRRGGKCLSETYTSSRARLRFCCQEGHVWEARADSVLYTDKWCPECARKP
jgi:hypothetical protein